MAGANEKSLDTHTKGVQLFGKKSRSSTVLSKDERSTAMTSAVNMTLTIGRLGLMFAVSWTSLLISGQAGNAPSSAAQQSLFTNAPGSPVAVQGGPSNILIGDMNNDRKLDLVIACARTGDDEIQLSIVVHVADQDIARPTLDRYGRTRSVGE